MEKFKKFWVMEINNWICDAAYNGKQLKEKHPVPSFRKFWFIKSAEDLKGFSKRNNITNENLVTKLLEQS